MTLLFDTTDRFRLRVSVRDGERQLVSLDESVDKPDQQLLWCIDQALSHADVLPRDITAIEVAEGPGSFTGTRVGVAVANALAWAWSVPVNGRRGFVRPVYAAAPHITPPA